MLWIVLMGSLAAAANLQAQAVLNGSGGIDLNGGSDFTPSAQTGSANRFLWLPGKAALRFGHFSSGTMLTNPANIGLHSIAGGYDAFAPGQEGIAIGANTLADGYGAVALGSGALADGADSFSAHGSAAADFSIALVGGSAGGVGSVAVGQGTLTLGTNSVAIGVLTSAYADFSTAFGLLNKNVRKDGSTPEPNAPAPGDPIFEVGNADPVTWVPSNALTIFRDGTISLPGNVGIGTTNPTQKLSVNGTIQAKEIVVQTGWSDYVFADDYCLAPLSEIEQCIKEEKHLPGIPSAAEVAEHGVSLGDMQARLLAKIEELTLHQISQEKRIQTLENENAALRAH